MPKQPFLFYVKLVKRFCVPGILYVTFYFNCRNVSVNKKRDFVFQRRPVFVNCSVFTAALKTLKEYIKLVGNGIMISFIIVFNSLEVS